MVTSMPMLAPGEARDFPVSAPLPIDQAQSLAVACVEFSDDNIANNCKTLMVTRPSTSTAGGLMGQAPGQMTDEQLRQAILQLIQSNPAYGDLQGFDLSGMEGDMSTAELKSLLDALRKNQATVVVSQSNLPPSGAAAGA